MLRFFIFLLIILNGLTAANSQTPTQLLNKWSEKSPIEKVYLHFDKEDYLAGESIWFKAYLYADYLPDTISTALYVELLDPSLHLIDRKVLPVFSGDSFGDFIIPDSSKTGPYFIRAYSPTMLNQDNDFVFTKKIFVVGKSGYPVQQIEKGLRFEFFPEGGNLINGFSNTVAFKATNELGLPVNVSGVIRNEKGDSVLSFESYHDGMGFFEIESKPGTTFYAQVNEDGSAKKFYLPPPIEKGIVLNVLPDPLGIYYSVKQKKGDADFEAAYMIGQMANKVVFEKQFTGNGNDWITGVINTGNLYSGIMQITIFNKAGLPLAERLTFIDNKEYLLHGELKGDTINFNPRSLNNISLTLKDTIIGSFSVSVTDPDYGTSDWQTEGIVSNLLLTSDLKGYIHHPLYYFSADNDSIKNALDLVMMTNGWRRFKWVELLKNSSPAIVYKDPTYISLRGQINLRDTHKPLPDRDLVVIISTQGLHGSMMKMIKTDANGNYKLDSMVIYGKSRILFSDIRGRKSKWIDVNNRTDSISKRYNLSALKLDRFSLNANSKIASPVYAKLNKAYDESSLSLGRVLDPIVINARRKSPTEMVEEKYVSGMFSGNAEKTLDLVNSDEALAYPTIFEYIEGRVPGVSITREGFDYNIFYRQGVTMSMNGNLPMTIFLNEIETDRSFISAIPVAEIAMVKIFTSFAAAAGNAPGGVLAIYTKKGDDLSKAGLSSSDVFVYNGFSFTREFYSPDYSIDSLRKIQKDSRITLKWKPDMFVKGINPVIPIRFYNNDKTRRFKVVVEGMTKDGKIIFLEKIFGAAPPKPF